MSTGSTARRRSVSLKARLAGRQRPQIKYPLLVDVDRRPAAAAALDQAVRDHRLAVLANREDPAAVDAARAAVDAAQADLEGCYEQVLIRALPAPEYERLIAAHPPTPEQAAQDPPQIWNEDSFRPALLAACVDSDMTADDWADFLAEHCSSGERQGLYVAALAVNEQERVAEPVVLPKGSTIRS